MSAPRSPTTLPIGRALDCEATWVALRRPDRGLITFEAENVEQAQRAVDTDPFLQEGLLKAHWLKQWLPE